MSSPNDQAEVPPSAGLVGGKYQLVKLIGRGGMGSVWEARHSNLGTPVAIKFIEAEYANSTEARSRFDKEAKAAATIQSKHAIQVFDNGITEEGKPYIVMELLTGEPLDKRIERLGTMTIQDTARIMQQVCRGLAKAHERGIVHRDLKPENVFIVRNNDDDDEVAKVLDFGIAKVSGVGGSSPGITSSTKTGAVLGTPFYMSPEQARGLRNVDHRTDVWSLGVIAFKCVTGRLPFDGESVGDLLVKICTAPVPLPSHFNPSLPPAFDSWFLRALEREPERRFQNVTELSEHLAFAAGLHDPRARGPMSSQQNGAYSGVPSGPATIAASSQQPSGPQPPSNYGPPPVGPYGSNPGAYTPNPAGMTNAPFTSSQPVPVAGGRAKWYVGAAMIGLLLAGVASFAVVKMKDARRAVATNGVTQSAGALTNEPKLEPTTPPAPPTTLTTADTGQTAAPPLGGEPAAATSEKPEKHPGGGGGGKVTGAARPPSGRPQGVTGGGLVSPPPPPPPQTNVTLPPPPPPAPTKKPSGKRDDDPGY